MAVFGFFALARVVNWIMEILSAGVNWLISTGMLPLTSILIEPAKVFFLNNAINHGVLTPLGTAQAEQTGKSILFLLEANPGPGLGILLAFTFFGVGAAKASAPGAAIIQFFGGIHEVYFPYVLMKPALLLAVIPGGMSGVATNLAFKTGLRAPAAPGSIIAVIFQTANDSYLGVILSVVISCAVTFAIAAVILRSSRRRDLEKGAEEFADAVAKTEVNKGKESAALTGLLAAETAQASTAVATRTVRSIVFACDAGMGSSAMGASVLRNKIAKAGVKDVTVTNLAIANLDASADLVVTQAQLTDRARQQAPDAIHVSVDNFMNSPSYDEVVDSSSARRPSDPNPRSGPCAPTVWRNPYQKGDSRHANTCAHTRECPNPPWFGDPRRSDEGGRRSARGRGSGHARILRRDAGPGTVGFDFHGEWAGDPARHERREGRRPRIGADVHPL
jgi:PTS system mannitol-specific IIC component